MYGLEKDVSLSFLVNRELIQILVGAYQLILRFDGDISIAIEGVFDHRYGGRSLTQDLELPAAAASVLRLIGQTVVSADNMGEGELRLQFSNDETISLMDSNQSAESYQIEGPGVNVIV